VAPPEVDPVAVVEVEVVLVLVPVLEGAPRLAPPVGTVNSGAPEVLVLPELPPPQAATPVASEPPARRAAMNEAGLRAVMGSS
jgi:hypothetical protein